MITFKLCNWYDLSSWKCAPVPLKRIERNQFRICKNRGVDLTTTPPSVELHKQLKGKLFFFPRSTRVTETLKTRCINDNLAISLKVTQPNERALTVHKLQRNSPVTRLRIIQTASPVSRLFIVHFARLYILYTASRKSIRIFSINGRSRIVKGAQGVEDFICNSTQYQKLSNVYCYLFYITNWRMIIFHSRLRIIFKASCINEYRVLFKSKIKFRGL